MLCGSAAACGRSFCSYPLLIFALLKESREVFLKISELAQVELAQSNECMRLSGCHNLSPSLPSLWFIAVYICLLLARVCEDAHAC